MAESVEESLPRPRSGGLQTLLSPLTGSVPFRYFFVSNVFTHSGFWAHFIVLGWLAFDLTRSEFAVALFTASRFASMLFGPVGGLLSDRMNRIGLLLWSNVVAIAMAVWMAVMLLLGMEAYWQVVLSGLAVGAMQAILQPARMTLVMDMMRRDQLPSANALSTAAMNGSSIIAPAIAGILIASFGPGAALWFCVIWYIPGILFLFPVKERPDRRSNSGVGVFTQIFDGFRVCFSNRAMAGILVVSFTTNLCAWPVIMAFLPVFAEEVLEAGPSGLGYLVAANGAGALFGALVIASLGDFKSKGVLFLTATAGFGLSLTAFAFTTDLGIALALILVAGVFSAGFGVMQFTLMLLLAPEASRAQAMGVLMMAIGVLPIASLIQGAIATVIGVVWTTIVAGLLLALVMAVLALTNRGLRQAT